VLWSSDLRGFTERSDLLHVGTAIYGNIGAADRLDFTVIGPAVNLVSRIERVAKALNRPIVVSDDFARTCGKPLEPLGRHELRGLATPTICFRRFALLHSARRSCGGFAEACKRLHLGIELPKTIGPQRMRA
jgi:hypothetical protein